MPIVFALLLAFGAVAFAEPPRVVRLTTADDVGVFADFYAATTNPAPAVLLLHSLGKARDEWAGFAPLLQRVGFAVLAIDLRGHGESSRRLTADGPHLVDFNTFAPRDFAAMLLDVNAAFDWLASQP